MKDLVNGIPRDIYIWNQDEYVEFTRRLSRPEIKSKVCLRLVNVKKNKQEEGTWAKKLGSNSEIYIFFFWAFIKST